jgi:hypothetical protein
MVRAAIAICLPLTVAIALHQRAVGLLIAMGGLMGTVVDQGGPYPLRIKRVGTAALVGGAAGLGIGSVIHGRGWLAVFTLVAVAGVAALLSAVGEIGSVTGQQLLLYSTFGLGPIGALHPWWHTALGFVFGTVWALILTVPGWLLAPRAAEERSLAAVYRALAAQLGAVGTAEFVDARRDVTAALNRAYDALAARTEAGWRSRAPGHLMALLNQANLVAEAAAALNHEGNRPPPHVVDTVAAVADAIGGGFRAGTTIASRSCTAATRSWETGRTSPGALALSDALDGVTRLVLGTAAPAAALTAPAPSIRDRVAGLRARVTARSSRTFALRLMASVGVAGVMTEVLPLRRSYWVVLTVAIVLKPDFGSVFTRAIHRGVGTVVGAVLGAVILVLVPYGPWLLVPFGVLAALLPYGRSRSHGLFSTFLTPPRGGAHRPAHAGRLAARRGAAARHAARLRDRVAGRVRPVAGELARPPAGPARGDDQGHRPVHGRGTRRRPDRRRGRRRGRLEAAAVPVMAAPPRLPGAVRPARRVQARHVGAVRRPPRRRRMVAGGGRARRGHRRRDRRRGGHLARRSRPLSGRTVRRLSGKLRAAADGLDRGDGPGATGLPSPDRLEPVTAAIRSVLAAHAAGTGSAPARSDATDLSAKKH